MSNPSQDSTSKSQSPSQPPEIPDESEWKKGGARFTSKRYSEYFDPCQEAADRSLKCLRRNGGDRKMCTDYFEAYKDCKKAWMEEMKEEKRRNGKSWFG